MPLNKLAKMTNNTILKELRIVKYITEEGTEYFIEIDADSPYSVIVRIDSSKFEELKNTYNLIEKVYHKQI